MTPPERFESYSSRRVFLIRPAPGGEHEVRRGLVVGDVEDLRDLLARLEGQQVRDVLALGVAAALGQLVAPWRGRRGRGW